MKYPQKTPESDPVGEATRIQLARWARFLPKPANELETAIIKRINKRFQAMRWTGEGGGWCAGLSQVIGWRPPKEMAS